MNTTTTNSPTRTQDTPDSDMIASAGSNGKLIGRELKFTSKQELLDYVVLKYEQVNSSATWYSEKLCSRQFELALIECKAYHDAIDVIHEFDSYDLIKDKLWDFAYISCCYDGLLHSGFTSLAENALTRFNALSHVKNLLSFVDVF